MKLAAAAAMAVLEMTAWAGDTAPDGTRVTVCIQDGGHTTVRYQAAAQASKMYASIGVTLDWRSTARSCTAPDAIHITLSDRTPDTRMPGALAYALPYEGTHIDVFFDRIEKTAGPEIVRYLLAHVLVHEIGHILQGIDRHSKTGVMKAHWTGVDYGCMFRGYLPFTEEDAILIHRGLEVRAGRMLVSALRDQTVIASR